MISVRYIGGPADGWVRPERNLGSQIEVEEVTSFDSPYRVEDSVPTAAQIGRSTHIYRVVQFSEYKALAIHSSVPFRKIGIQEPSLGKSLTKLQLTGIMEYLIQKLEESCRAPADDGVLYGLERGTVDFVYDESRRLFKAFGIAIAREYGPDKSLATYTPWHKRLDILLDLAAEKQYQERKHEFARRFNMELDAGRPAVDAFRIAAEIAGLT